MSSIHFADRLINACRTKGAPVCVGLDPVFARLPQQVRDDAGQDAVEAIRVFCAQVIGVLAPHVPCVKIQSACFERYHWRGVSVYYELVQIAASAGLIVIADAKRGDIGVSSEHYADGHMSDPHTRDMPVGADAMTINGYLGIDAIQPFIDTAARASKGLFVLVRTSNPGSDAIQSLTLEDGRTVADAMAKTVADAGTADGLVGQSGFSCLGAVVGATKPADMARLRDLMPQQIFLVPGVGAQGASANDARACFRDDGTGAIINSSRGVIYAYAKHDTQDWRGSIEQAAVELKEQIASVVC